MPCDLVGAESGMVFKGVCGGRVGSGEVAMVRIERVSVILLS